MSEPSEVEAIKLKVVACSKCSTVCRVISLELFNWLKKQQAQQVLCIECGGDTKQCYQKET